MNTFLASSIDIFNFENVWVRDGYIIMATVAVHLVIKVFVLRTLQRIADATENDLDDRLLMFFRRFYLILLLVISLLTILKNHDVEITPLLASAGIAGIAIGLAAKETLADIFAGIFLIADRPIRIGDRIKIDRIGKHWGSWGDVVDIGFRRTQVKNTDGVIVNYPNNLLANSVITNFSILDEPIRVRIRFQVDYDADMKKVMRVTQEAIESTPDVVPESSSLMIRELWSDDGGHQLAGVLVEARYFLEDVRVRTRVRSAVLENILTSFQEENIVFASPSLKIEQQAAFDQYDTTDS